MDHRLERNWKMANAASENVTRPATKEYRDNYDCIRWKNTTETPGAGSSTDKQETDEKQES